MIVEVHVCVSLSRPTPSPGVKNTPQRSAINNVISHPLWETTSTEGGRVSACSTRRLLREGSAAQRRRWGAGGGTGSAPRKIKNKNRRILCVRSAPPRKQHQPHARTLAQERWRRHHDGKKKARFLAEGLEVEPVRPRRRVGHGADEVPPLQHDGVQGVLACSAGHNRG